MKLSYLDLMTTDPSYNLAMEQYVFDCLPRDRMYFMLWQNDNAIIVGKYQNTISEINEEAVRERGIRVVRRLSGGGAVYHDMGNLNFTFITDAGGSGTLDMKLFCRAGRAHAGGAWRQGGSERTQRHHDRREEVLR